MPFLSRQVSCCRKQIVETPALIDLALVKGLDFPESPRGIFGWAESLGPENVVQRLKQLANLGERFHPTKWLIDQAASRHLFLGRSPFQTR